MEVRPTTLPEVRIVQHPVFRDSRGAFTDIFEAGRFAAAGLPTTWVQDSQSHNHRGVVRGLHYQIASTQGKLVRAITGRVFDVAVDLRRSSPTFAEWVGIELEEGDGQQVYIPPGFAHGFLTLSETAILGYKMTAPYTPSAERVIAWNDPTLAIAWPVSADTAITQSPRDAAAPSLTAAEVFP
jgi:dTDP-4-dehydrorhamnose 3,5-epimerase